ncbi:stage III sporulation protein SpoIIIAA [Nonomuraea soli]|uniref:Stage III sporulation protein SpoIIIAA n=1 Tax=Nonomuraea soli TaxID=1032476 RepID=A0A7W0CDW6_9ACTN|nr:stage III sporulation protein SpoIIIAA [Nonomuraea soli]
MSVPREEFNALVERVEVLETWAGPGQAEALAQTIRSTRTDVTDIKGRMTKIESRMTSLERMVTVIQQEHGVLLREILDRLPSK